MYGQSCPTVDEPEQVFCSAFSTVADLEANGTNLLWYESANSSQPLPSGEILINGEDYFAGSSDCQDSNFSRPSVAVELTAPSAPVVQDEFFTPCIGAGPYDIADLKESVDVQTVPSGYSLQVFGVQFDPNAIPLADSELLTEGNYYLGFVNGSGDCHSLRRPVRFDPVEATAPAAMDQVVCEGTTVSQLDAEGTNLWYRSANSIKPLPNDTPVANGTTYYASMVVPSDGPPCESDERTPVTVTTSGGVTEETQRFCESIGGSDDFRTPEVQDLSPAGDWYADDTFTTPLDPNTELVDEAQYFQIGSAECEVLIVTAEFFSTPNAGSTTQVSYCETDVPVNLVDEISNSILGAPDQTGYFTPALENNIFDPASFGPGSYTFRYTVEGNEDCPTDTSQISVTVQEGPNAGGDVNEEVCTSELEDISALISEFSSYLEDRDQDGIFDNNSTQEVETYNLQELGVALFSQYDSNGPNGVGTYSYTYTVVDGITGCTDSATIDLEISQSPDAGTNGTIQLSEGTPNTISLSEALEGNPDPDGIWTNENDEVVDGSLIPQEPGVFTYTVTVGECSATATVTVLAVPQDCPEITQPEQRFCASIVDGNNSRRPNVSDLLPSNATWYATEDSTDPLPVSTLLVDGTVYFAGNSTGDCENRASVTVDIFDTPNAGSTTTVPVCSNASEFDLVNSIQPSILGAPQTTGYFSPALSTGTNIFNPEDYAAGRYTFTYIVEGNDDCPTDEAVIYVDVLEAPNVGESLTIYLEDRDDSEIDLLAELGGDTGGTWDAGNGTFDPTSDTTPASFTYTITSGNGCTDSATITILAEREVCPEVTQTQQRFCASIGEGNNSRQPTVSDLEPANATWYATADSTESLDITTELVDDAIYFAGTSTGDCESRASVTVEIFDTPNAGSTTTVPVCSNESEFDLVSRIQPSILGAPQTTGYFSPALSTGTNIFDPEDYAPGRYTFTYTVEGNDDCPTDEAVIYVNVTAAPDAGGDINETFCVADISEIVNNQQDFLDFFSDDERTAGGTFTPPLEDLALQFSNNPYDTFSTVYSVTVNGCTDTANLSITIDQEEPANAGGKVEVTLCSTDGVQNLEDLLNSEAILGGTFSAPYEDGTFDPSTAGADPVVITYTVGEDDACVTDSDSATITITVIEGPDAGEEGSITLNLSDEPVNLFDSLEGTPDTGGTWTPGAENGQLDPSSLEPGNYTYTYTVVSANECTNSAIVAVTIEGDIVECPVVTQTEQAFCESIETGNNSRLPRVSDLSPSNAVWYPTADSDEALPSSTVLVNGATYFAGNVNGTCEDRDSVTVTLDDSPNAGATTQVTFCENGDAVDLLTVINSSVLGAPDAGGTFSPALASGTSVFDPAVDAAGTYTYRVESTNDVCPADIAVITISLTAAPNAGSNVELTFCLSDGEQNLFSYLPDGVSDSGDFEGLTDGLFTPSETGEFTFEYSVGATGTCEGTSTADYIITVVDSPAAPTVVNFDGCVADGATVANLQITGEEGAVFTVYSDETLQTEVGSTEVLTQGDYFVTQTNAGGCVSDAATITVTLSASDAPTLTGNLGCVSLDSTIANLEDNVSANGDITWYATATSTDPLSRSTTLVDGTTYYATSTNNEGCESSARLAVTVDFCPIVIPEIFTPNGDGVNDNFVIRGISSEYPNHKLEIYNRWGNMVYNGKGENSGWDGTSSEGSFGNGVLPVGVYFYILFYNDGQTAPTQGRVYLSR